jgi:tetratricopeptide (TPR) repeat protein
MNNRAANTPSGVQWTGLLLLVVCFGLAASWIIKSWSYDSDTDVSRIEEASNNSVRPSIDIETAKTPHDDVSLQPTIALPRQSFVISGDQLELECGSFIDRLQTNLPNDSKALNLAALFYSRTQQTIKADELWKKVLSMAPRDLSLYFNWSSNAIQQGQSDRALEILDQAERNGVRDPQLLYQRSVSLSNLGRDEEVESLLVPFATSKEMDGSHWLQLGLSQSKLGKHELARESLLRARELGVNGRTLLNGLINCSARLKDRQAAEAYRKELDSLKEEVTEFGQDQYEARSEARIRSVSMGIMGEGIEVYRLAGRPLDAEHAALRVLALEPNSADVCNLLLEIYVAKKEYHNQYAVLERLTELQPGNLLNYLLMAKAASMGGNQARAEGLIKLTIATAPEDVTSWIAMAEFLIERNRSAESVWYIEQAIVREPSRDAYKLLANALRASGQNDRAAIAEAKAEELTKIPTIRAQAPKKGP